MAERKLSKQELIEALQHKAFSPEDAQAWAQCLIANDLYLASQFTPEAVWEQLLHPPKPLTLGLIAILGQLFGLTVFNSILLSFCEFLASFSQVNICVILFLTFSSILFLALFVTF
jgi:hypothetical protein